MNKFMLGTGVACASLLVSLPSHSFDFNLSGQVNSAAVFGGDVEDLEVVDNNTSGSRFRIRGKQDFGGNYNTGFRLEFQDQDNVSNTLEDRTDTEVRVSDVFVGGPFGKIGVGKGDGATDSTFEAYGLLNYLGGAESWLLFAGVLDLNYRSIDGIGRQNRIRYDTPNFGGFRAALSANSGDTNEVSFFYKGDVAGGTLDARAGFVDRDSGDVTSSSIAYKHGIGFGLSYSFSEDDNPLAERETDWLMASYTIGITTVSIGTGDFDQSTITNDEGVTTALTGTDEMSILGINIKPTPGLEIYANYVDFENRDGVDGDAFALGARIRF